MSFSGFNTNFINGNGDPGGSRGRPPDKASSDVRSRSNSRGSNPPSQARKSNDVIMNEAPSVVTVPTRNAFTLLNNNAQEHEIIRTSEPITTSDTKNPGRVPQITIFNISIKELSSKVALSLPNLSQSIRYRLTQFGIKAYAHTIDDFKKLRSYLMDHKINFFSHPLREERTRKFTLHGLHDMNTDDVKDLLYESDIAPINVAKLNIRNKRYDDHTIYLLYYPYVSNISIEKLRTVKYIDHVVVRFEEYSVNKTNVTQCANCLNFGHGAKNCFLPPRCIKCGDNHKSVACDKNLKPTDPKSKIPKSQVKCANCQGSHTANYSKCPSRLKFLEIREVARTNRNKISKSNRTHTPNRPNISSRSAYHREQISNSNSWAKTVQRSTSNELFSPTECYQIFKTFLNEIVKCKSKIEQIDVITRLSLDFIGKNVSP